MYKQSYNIPQLRHSHISYLYKIHSRKTETTQINATPRVEALLKWILTIISCGTSWIKSLHDTHMIFWWRVSFNTSQNLQWENKYHGLIKSLGGKMIIGLASTNKPIQDNCRSCDLGDSNTFDIVSYLISWPSSMWQRTCDILYNRVID